MTIVVSISAFWVAENGLLREALALILNKRNEFNGVGTATFFLAVVDAMAAISTPAVMNQSRDTASSLVFRSLALRRFASWYGLRNAIAASITGPASTFGPIGLKTSRVAS